MGDDESGGLAGLRAWAADATVRAERLLPVEGALPPTRHEYDRSVDELTQLEQLLTHDAALRSSVSVRLGVVLTLRYLLGGGTPEDRERARDLFRRARDPQTGAATSVVDAQWATVLLLKTALPVHELPGVIDGNFDIPFLLNWHARKAGLVEDAFEEIRSLLADVRLEYLPPELAQHLEQTKASMVALEGAFLPGGAERLMATLPPDFPFAAQMAQMMDVLSGNPGAAGSAFGPPAAGPTPSSPPFRPAAARPTASSPAFAPATPPPATTGPARSDDPPPPAPPTAPAPPAAPAPAPTTAAEPAADTTKPTKPTEHTPDRDGPPPGDAAAPGMFSAMLSAYAAGQDLDPAAYDAALRQMSQAYDQLSPDADLAPMMRTMTAAMLQVAHGNGGNLRDSELGRRLAQAEGEQHTTRDLSTPLGAQLGMGRLLSLGSRLSSALDAEDLTAIDAVIAELRRLEAQPSGMATFHASLLMSLGQAYTARAELTRNPASRLIAAQYLERAAALKGSVPPVLGKMLDQLGNQALSAQARFTSDPERLRSGLKLDDTSTSLFARYDAARHLGSLFALSGDLADLDRAITAFEELGPGVREGGVGRLAAEIHWYLAELYHVRWLLAHAKQDLVASTDSARESLRALTTDVLLQLGSEHGLLAARSSVERGVRAAFWSGTQGRVEEAVAALELGRALVLHAASASATVPERLRARGHDELAEAWQAAVDAPDDAPAGPGLPRELPSSLRRRALEALGYRQEGLMTTPTVAEIQAAVADADADALVYLVAGFNDAPGMAVVVGPDTGAGTLGLPLLSGAESGPLERYLDAAAERSRHIGEPAAEQAWEEALSQLCDWAFTAVIGPVTEDVAQRLQANENRRRDRPGGPRLVLVPCGKLGVVPWHAARLPEAAPKDYACQIMVISYAASAGQFLRTVKRARRDPAAAPVLVADPRIDLPWAEQEALALREAFYPAARLYGEFYEPPVAPESAGTPDELLGLLHGDVSLLHVASHGSTGTRPTVSALHLAVPDGTEVPPTGECGKAAETDPGMLTVTRLLDHTAGRTTRPDGPLVVLSACETDLSNRDHDEALTLTTAFVAGGARDVVGSRWTTQDAASALMMTVFHHHLAVEGLSPADALRAAQMWMLDPGRRNPGTLSGELLREMARPGLERPAIWAAFTHQGHPGPGRRGGGAV
ncbi:CHAT domain-containing protein [Streptomyces sp. NPDC000410]|uniref:CHAT domain-containing protein n=1 Tax=Streptomyces sp. NPDC000410 TaxID=3154254 RepID=UPI00332B3712